MQESARISPAELDERISSGREIVLVDVRRRSYDRSDAKIKGAVRIHPNSLLDRPDQIPPGSEVVTYCT